MVKEHDILQAVRLEASRLGALTWRNNQGAYKDAKGYYIKYGVCNPGGSDLVGIYKGLFLGLEIKQPGKQPTDAQLNFIETINKHGGIACVISDPEQLKNILK